MKQTFIAHVRKSDGQSQPLQEHLIGTAQIAQQLANKFNLPICGQLIGLVHDLGKYSQTFQNYIKSATGIYNPDEDDYIDAKGLKGKIDHSTAGGQWLIQNVSQLNTAIKNSHQHRKNGELLAEILALCVFSHHSGLIDMMDVDKNQVFADRAKKDNHKTHCNEAIKNAEQENIFNQLPEQWKKDLIKEFSNFCSPILSQYKKGILLKREFDFYMGFLARLLFSCLIDADRSDSIAFEYPERAKELGIYTPNWQLAIDKIENLYQQFAKNTSDSPIMKQRNHIAKMCLENANQTQGIFSLTVPTGGGKTLASLRFALHHAKQHSLDKIIYIIPFTSIIEQNAEEIRKILEDDAELGQWVLEQHSNLEPNIQTWQSKLIADNWNAPIIFTTMVQFLESCFAGGTKGVRRLHQLSRAVLVFDEIQTLPLNCYHLFINTINFLTQYTQTTALLCTATQPVLNKIDYPQAKENGILNTPVEIIGNQEALNLLFDTLTRVDIHDKTQIDLNDDALFDFVTDTFNHFQSTLVIVNTKAWAMKIYQALRDTVDDSTQIFHLSTGQCAKHRKDLIQQIKQRLKEGLPTLVISTQLIEAGVDISFKSVIRFLAGLDSILQASGRCNRHGEMKDEQGNTVKGQVFIIQPEQESLLMLPTIAQGKKHMGILLEKLRYTDNQGKSLLSPDLVEHYFKSLYLDKDVYEEMSYKVNIKGYSNSLLNLLSHSEYSCNDNDLRIEQMQYPKLWQSFMQAGNLFKAIDAPTQAVIVPYGDEGQQLIRDLCALETKNADFSSLLRQAQAYSINVFPFMYEKLVEAGALHCIESIGVVVLQEQFYDDVMGLNPKGDSHIDYLEAW